MSVLSDSYKKIESARFASSNNPDDWRACPDCGHKPRLWIFDNGEHAACECGEEYRPSGVSVHGVCWFIDKTDDYDKQELLRAWNAYVSDKGA